jgi:signal transduction histidine kinase
MNKRHSTNMKSGSNADIAFAVVVLASYFATFASFRQAMLLDILLMIVLGSVYILIGIYGYTYCVNSSMNVVRVGYFLIQIPLGGLIVSLGRGAAFNALLLLPLVGQAVVLLNELWVYLINAAILGTYIVSAGSYASSWADVWSNMPIFLAGQVFIMVFTQSSVSEGKARREVERLVEELQAANQRLRENAVQAEELAVTKERNRVAREIHDGLGHFLTTIHMEIQAARAVMASDPSKALLMLEKAQTLSEEALTDVRSSVGALRASPEENLPLPELMEKLVHTCGLINLEAEFKVMGYPRPLSPPAHLTLYRAAQESINNICKHSQASQVWMALDYLNLQKIRLTIQDNGIGAEELDGGFGLMGLRERVGLLNGELTIQTAPDQGFRLEIEVPG